MSRCVVAAQQEAGALAAQMCVAMAGVRFRFSTPSPPASRCHHSVPVRPACSTPVNAITRQRPGMKCSPRPCLMSTYSEHRPDMNG